MKIAAIDIGTNAIKSKIFDTSSNLISFNESIRTPTRLGTDVFVDGLLSKASIEKLVTSLKKYQDYFNRNDIEFYEIVATSAFRDTKNSEDARRLVENEIEHPIRVISGLEEASLMALNPKIKNNDPKLYADLGGGSLEFFYYLDGKKKIKSFQLGAVRNMLRKDKPDEWKKLNAWLNKLPSFNTVVGIGGNIRSFLKIHNQDKISKEEFIKLKDKLNKLTFSEKISKHDLSEDRADVIDYAMSIYEFVLNRLDVKNIRSTKWGVSDSIAVKLYHELYSNQFKIKN
ncbi:MAG: Ppx/GppA phosphatase family protein [Gammaproteobacteria bacterium]|nr:MAG: phosphatase [Gammaproteobacteria bacterium TMED104]|tara:strand:+ start:17945 stop:18802 length:858 start_codon:yes stop_codon:yes gene_type:complete